MISEDLKDVLLGFASAAGLALLFFGTYLSYQDNEPKQTISYLSDKVVELKVDGDTKCTASAIGEGMFLTAGHCLRGSMEEEVYLEYEDMMMKPSRIHKEFGDGEDWAILYTRNSFPNTSSLSLQCDYEPEIGDELAYYGHAYPYAFDFDYGHVTGVDNLVFDQEVGTSSFFTSFQIGGGASGSAVVNMETDEVVGVLVEMYFNNNRDAFRTGVHSIKPVCDYLNEEG